MGEAMRKSLRFESVVATLLSIAVGVTSCKPAADDHAVKNAEQNEAAQLPLPSLPVVEQPMDRAAVLLAVERSASAAALGRDDREAQVKLDGKRIEVRIRFGCPTISSNVPGAPFNVRFDQKDRTLRLRASADLELKDLPAVPTAGEKPAINHIEGFWIRRPWLLEAGCPAIRPMEEADREKAGEAANEAEPKAKTAPTQDSAKTEPIQPELPPPPRIGIAQYYTEQDSRLSQRDGRPYEATKTLAEDETPSSVGYDLVLAGRLRALPGGKVIDCTVKDVNRPPTCIIFAQLDSVRMEKPDNRSLIAEWSRQ
jgi:hypothetical protein